MREIVFRNGTGSRPIIEGDIARRNDFADAYLSMGNYLDPTITGLYVNGEKIVVNKETKTRFLVDSGMIKIAIFDNNEFKDIYTIIPDIIDVKILDEKIVIMTFADETTTKAVLNNEDGFSIETGVIICIMKKMISYSGYTNYASIDESYADSIYNKLIRYGIKKIDAEKNRLEAIKNKNDEIKKRRQRIREKKARKAREKRINEMVEAINRSKIIDNLEKTVSEETNSEETDSKKVDLEKTDSEKTDSKK